MEKVRFPDNVKQKGKIPIDIIIIALNLSFYQLRPKTPKIYQSKSTKFLLALILPKGVRASWERDWFVNFWERESINVIWKKITFHVWSLIILLTNTARVKVLSSIMKMQILDQKMQNAGSRAFTIHKWIFCTFVTQTHPSKSVLSILFSFGSEYHYGHHKTSFLDIQGKNTKNLIYEQDPG